ncbi:MAG: integrin alpha [Pseudomonadota bacterium]
MSRPSCTLIVLCAWPLVPRTTQAALPASLDDIDADARWMGEAANDHAGGTIAGNADVNGDGYPDLLVGAYGSDDGAEGGGESYLLLGGPTRWSGDIGLDSATASWVGTTGGEYTSSALGLIPDMDGDSYDEIAIGSYCSDQAGFDAGELYLIYGEASAGWGTDRSLRDADVSWLGEDAWDRLGHAVAGLGDVNGDGLGDLLVGASWRSSASYKGGEAYLVLGPVSGVFLFTEADKCWNQSGGYQYDFGYDVAGGADFDGDALADFMISAWVYGAVRILHGRADPADYGSSYVFDATIMRDGSYESLGNAIDVAGDVDGDGLDDVLIGDKYHDGDFYFGGAAYLLLSPIEGTVNVRDHQLEVMPSGEREGVGSGVAGVGDMDGDGYADFAVGAPAWGAACESSGVVAIFHGSASGGVAGEVGLELGEALIVGTPEYSGVGYNIAAGGDVDGDGSPDLMLGASSNNQTWLVHGPVRGVWEVDDIAAYHFDGVNTGDQAGYAISMAGDADADGLTDLLIGAKGEDSYGENAGAAYLIFGSSL